MRTTQKVDSERLALKLPKLNLLLAAAISKTCDGPSGIEKVKIAALIKAPTIRIIPWMASVQITA